MLAIYHENELVHLKLEANNVDDLHEDSLAQVCFELPFALPYKPKDHESEQNCPHNTINKSKTPPKNNYIVSMKMKKKILIIDHEGEVVHTKFEEDCGNEFQEHPLLS
jgi:hypothetical protein